MNKIIPEKLKKGDEIRVIAPSRSMNLLSEETISLATKRSHPNKIIACKKINIVIIFV